ncbi:MAG TPA: DNA cytosine methyltransferase [Streptosporangiaceae bacterium]|nr:DNA cytosine methyltransferase [Streptosporangiaceae bacterium]
MTYTTTDFFCGAGGSSQGAAAVPGVEVKLAANHWQRAIDSHSENFPGTEHFRGDLHDYDVAKFGRTDLFWASPECTEWTSAKGRPRDWNKQPDLFGETLPDEAADRSRALMWDVPRYLDAMKLRGEPVLGGVVENVVEAREGLHWDEWVRSIRNLGYNTWLIALNSMHARPARSPLAPQSRDRLYFAYLLATIAAPDWHKWLRPMSWCPGCGKWVAAMQVWKQPGRDMGKYRTQYVYRCPRISCRGQVVEPPVLPAMAVIDWSNLGTRIGDRNRPLAAKTLARIDAGLKRYSMPITLEVHGNTFERRPGVRTWPVFAPVTTQTTSPTKGVACPPMVVPAGGTWRDDPSLVSQPLPTRTATESDGLACPPFLAILRGRSVTQGVSGPLGSVTAMGAHHGLVVPPFLTVHRSGRLRTSDVTDAIPTLTASGNHLGLATPMPFAVPVEGRDGKEPIPVTAPHRTQTGRAETGLAVPPLALIMRNNSGGGEMCTLADEPLRTMTTHGHQSLLTWQQMASHLLVPYYSTGVARPVTDPAGTMSARDRYALVSAEIDIDDVLFRMLEPAEIGGAMAFYPDYIVLGSKREKVRQYGNAVTPPVAEILFSALVEAISGEDLELAA